MTNPDSRLPGDFNEDRLLRNLEALGRVDPQLAERLRLPVTGDHVSFGSDGRAAYRLHRGTFELSLTEAQIVDGVDASDADGVDPDAPSLLHFGIGCGELLLAAMAGHSASRHIAWERDPWLLRILLARFDLADALLGRKLELALGVDLIRHLDAFTGGAAVVLHPRLKDVYADELACLRSGLPERRVALVVGGLFVEPLARAFRERGFGVWPLCANTQAPEELDLTLRDLAPELVFSVNHIEGLVEFCHGRGIALAVWEVDPASAPPRRPRAPTDRTYIFAHRRAGAETYRAAGFEHAHYLPLAADPELRRPLDGVDRDVPLAFVGSSLVANALNLRAAFVSQWSRWRDGEPQASEEAEALQAELVQAQAGEETRFLIPDLLAERVPEFMAAWAAGDLGEQDPRILIGEEASAQRRLQTLVALAPFEPRVWGDAGWRAVEAAGVRYEGEVGHRDALTEVYGRARVSLDINRLYQADIVTMRVFDVLASGGTILAASSLELDELFEPGVEVESWATHAELGLLVRRALDEPDRAAEIAKRGREAVLRRHTIDQRLGAILAVVGGGAMPSRYSVRHEDVQS